MLAAQQALDPKPLDAGWQEGSDFSTDALAVLPALATGWVAVGIHRVCCLVMATRAQLLVTNYIDGGRVACVPHKYKALMRFQNTAQVLGVLDFDPRIERDRAIAPVPIAEPES